MHLFVEPFVEWSYSMTSQGAPADYLIPKLELD